jgi:tetraacyldisaccharide 4'-kinase
MDNHLQRRIQSLLKPLLAVLAIIYGLVVRLRVALYCQPGMVKQLPRRVISVGNLTVGGTGKTPCVAWIARYLNGEGERVAILSRGYRREGRGLVEVSDGQSILATPRQSGDEPWLLARACPGVRVVVDSRRFAAGSWLIGKVTNVSVFLLDDGFQHLQLARDLNLLLVDAGDPLPQARLAPLGRLREPLSQLCRADAVIITRSDQDYDRRALADTLARHLRPGTPVFHATHELTSFCHLDTGDVRGPDELSARRVAAIAGIGRPERFYHDLRQLGLDLVWTRSFADHHHYQSSEQQAILDAALSAGAQALLMTEKDAANWPPGAAAKLPVYAGRIEFRCREQEALEALLRAK